MNKFLSITAFLITSALSVHAQSEAEAMYLWNPGQQEASNVYNLSEHPAIGKQGDALVITLEGKTERTITFTPGMKITFGKAVDSTGDVNHDTKVNIDDVTEIINVICGAQEKLGADVNKDNTVNIDDVTEVINIICGK